MLLQTVTRSSGSSSSREVIESVEMSCFQVFFSLLWEKNGEKYEK